MVKLASVRETRKYGPVGAQDIWEAINAFGYLVAALLLLAGSVLLLPGYNVSGGLWLILIGLVFILIVNVHDLLAQLAGFDFRLPLITLDPQLALIEIAAPLVQAIGAVVYFIGAFLLLRVSRGDYDGETTGEVSRHAYRLLIAAPALWLLGSIHNSFQLYANTELQVQAYQRGVTLPFVIGSVLLVLSGVVNIIFWPAAALHTVQVFAASLAVAGTALFVIGALVNAVRIIEIQQTQQHGGHVEKLRGGAQEALIQQREEAETYAPVTKDDDYTEIESGQPENPYKSSVVAAADLER